MTGFLTVLSVSLVDDAQADGRGMWRLEHPLVFQSAVLGRAITVPECFETDFASVPRVPVAYWLAGDTAHPAAVVHDYLYSTGEVSRATADRVLLEAMAAEGVPAWRRYPMYWAVRAFGGSRFGPTYQP